VATVPAAAVGAMKTLQISSGWNIWINELGKELEQRVGERTNAHDQRVGETGSTSWGNSSNEMGMATEESAQN
jgi:hypothetical protein